MAEPTPKLDDDAHPLAAHIEALWRIMSAEVRESAPMPVLRSGLKRALVVIWRMMPPEDRKAFLARVDVDDARSFTTWHIRWPDRNDLELEDAARHWSYVVPTLEGAGKDYDFAKSIKKRLRRRNFNITDKQVRWVKRLYRDWKRYADLRGEVTE